MLSVHKAAHYINLIHALLVLRIMKFSKRWQVWVRHLLVRPLIWVNK